MLALSLRRTLALSLSLPLALSPQPQPHSEQAAKKRDPEILRKEMERLADKQDKAEEKKKHKMKGTGASSKHMLTSRKSKVQRVKDDPKDKAATEADVKVDITPM